MNIPLIDIGSFCNNKKCIETYTILGYRAACIEGLNHKIIRKNNFIAVRKSTIYSESQKDLKHDIRNEKSRSFIIAIVPLSIEAARFAARDGRVDTVVLIPDSVRYIDKTEIAMLKRFSKPLEVPINILITQPSSVKAMIIRRIDLALKYNVTVILSSWAHEWNEILAPISYTALGSVLLRIPMKDVLVMLTNYTRELMVKNGVHI